MVLCQADRTMAKDMEGLKVCFSNLFDKAHLRCVAGEIYHSNEGGGAGAQEDLQGEWAAQGGEQGGDF